MENGKTGNMPFEILSIEREFKKEDWGDDIVFFRVIVSTDKFQMEVSVMFDSLKRFLYQTNPEISKYFSSVRGNIAGFGPKQSKMFEIFDEEGFDFEPHIYEYIKNKFSLEEEYERQRSIGMDAIVSENVKKVYNDLKGLHPLKSSTIKWEEYGDNVLDFANKEALRLYPELLEADAEIILELKSILIGSIRGLTDAISNLAYKAKK